MKNLIFIITLCIATSVVAQKHISQTYSIEGISELFINSNEIFKITISATDTDIITVDTIIDGETFASTLLNTSTKDSILKITTGKTPDYIPFNDKLSAHKVIAIELEITIPKDLNLSIYSTLAAVKTKGQLGLVHIDLGRGYFIGEEFHFRESAIINTLSGDINIFSNDKALVTAQSRSGDVVIPKDFIYGNPLKLQSISGDITINKSR